MPESCVNTNTLLHIGCHSDKAFLRDSAWAMQLRQWLCHVQNCLNRTPVLHQRDSELAFHLTDEE